LDVFLAPVFEPRDTIVKGFASVSDLLARPLNDQILNGHFILPDGQIGNNSWIGRDIRDVLKETDGSEVITLRDIDNSTNDLYAASIFFTGMDIGACNWREVNFSGSVSGDFFRVDDCIIGGWTGNSVFMIEGISQTYNSTYSGLQIRGCEFINITLLGSKFADLVLSDTKISAGIQIASLLLHLEMRRKTQIRKFDVMHVSSEAIFADFDSVGIKIISALPVAAYAGIKQIEINSIY